MKIPQTRSKSKPKSNFQRASSLERFEQPGKICDDYHRRWGDYNRVIKQRETEQMQWYPVCYEIFDAQRSPEHRKSEVEKYSYEKTQHFYDNRPQKNFLTTLNNTSDYRQVTAVKNSKSKDAVKEKNLRTLSSVCRRQLYQKSSVQIETKHLQVSFKGQSF